MMEHLATDALSTEGHCQPLREEGISKAALLLVSVICSEGAARQGGSRALELDNGVKGAWSP